MKIKYRMLLRTGRPVSKIESDNIKALTLKAMILCGVHKGQFCLDAKVGKDWVRLLTWCEDVNVFKLFKERI